MPVTVLVADERHAVIRQVGGDDVPPQFRGALVVDDLRAIFHRQMQAASAFALQPMSMNRGTVSLKTGA